MEEEKSLPPLIYGGQKVLTTRQESELLECDRSNVNHILKNHETIFKEGVDYFKLQGEELRQFKISLANELIHSAGDESVHSVFSKTVNSICFLTESGVLKLSKYIGTDKAKAIYTQLAVGYFKTENLPAQLESGRIFSDAEKFQYLNCYIKLTKDDEFREKLMKAAFKILMGEKLF